jgi:cyanophycinase
METSEGPAAGRPGALYAIGGAEDKVKERLILRSFVEACGGADAHVVVLATASEMAETGERYADLFYQLHADSVEVLRIANREDAIDAGPETLDLLEYSTGLFMTGGNQLRITSALGGTAIAQAIHRRQRAGMVVAGTSAGAAVLSEYMIAMGDSGGTPRRRLVQMAKGLGLAPHLVIDQHFRRRDRLGRLLTALSYNPEPLGIGIDEDTAAIFEGSAEGSAMMRVLGSGAVTVIDASGMRFTDSHTAHRDQPLAMLGLKLDFLTTGCRYDLARRRGIPAHAEPGRERAEDLASHGVAVESLS